MTDVRKPLKEARQEIEAYLAGDESKVSVSTVSLDAMRKSIMRRTKKIRAYLAKGRAS